MVWWPKEFGIVNKIRPQFVVGVLLVWKGFGLKMLAGLVGLDAFAKANDEYRLKTKSGAIGTTVLCSIP